MRNPNEFKRETTCGRTTWRKYAATKKAGTNDWYTNSCEHAANAIVPGSACQVLTFPANPLTGDPVATITFPTFRTPNAKDTNDGGYKQYFVCTDPSSTPPNAYLLVDYATP